MSHRAIVLYLHVHQPYRLRHYPIFDIAHVHNYFDAPPESPTNNERILQKVVEKSYLPTNQRLLELMERHPEMRLSLSLTGVVLEQLERYAPEALKSFQQLVATGRVDILAETYHHTLAFFYSRLEFETQVSMHREKIKQLFGIIPTVFRNTELAYNNELAQWVEEAGYIGVLAEGWDELLDWRSPNYIYKPAHTQNVKLLLKNYHLSDDIAFRFGDKNWAEWPLTVDKFVSWATSDEKSQVINLFMDYETFGEHQWEASGIFQFLDKLPEAWLRQPGNGFLTVSEAIQQHEPVGEVDSPRTVTWADTERDLSAWLGNSMQQSAINGLYGLEKAVVATNDWQLIDDWRRLQTSDHFYYMCTKWWNDGDIHAYFSPYNSPYEAFIQFMNVLHDIRSRLLEKGAL